MILNSFNIGKIRKTPTYYKSEKNDFFDHFWKSKGVFGVYYMTIFPVFQSRLFFFLGRTL